MKLHFSPHSPATAAVLSYTVHPYTWPVTRSCLCIFTGATRVDSPVFALSGEL